MKLHNAIDNGIPFLRRKPRKNKFPREVNARGWWVLRNVLRMSPSILNRWNKADTLKKKKIKFFYTSKLYFLIKEFMSNVNNVIAGGRLESN